MGAFGRRLFRISTFLCDTSGKFEDSVDVVVADDRSERDFSDGTFEDSFGNKPMNTSLAFYI